LRNDGTATATNISATLSTTTPGIAIIQPNSGYANIAAGLTASNTTAFQISTAAPYVCGTPVNLTLTLSYVGGTDTNSFVLTSGTTGYGITPSSGASIVPGSADVGNHGDDVTTTIGLPFTYTFNGQNFSSATLSANGNLQFASANNAFA